MALPGGRDSACGFRRGFGHGLDRRAGSGGRRVAHDHGCDLAIGFTGHFVEFGTELLNRLLQGSVRFIQRRLHALRGVFHFAFEFAQLVDFDFALDIGLNVVDVTLRATQQVADGAGYLGKAFGADDDQGDDADHHQFSETDIKHATAAREMKQ
ncbi:hypothetical protein D3C73_846410 [compost metagenome]